MTTLIQPTFSQRPTVEELHQPERYQLIESFPIDQSMDFFRRELGLLQPTPAQANRLTGKRLIFLLIVSILSGLLGYGLMRWLLQSGDGSPGSFSLWQPVVGFVSFFLLLPIHEFIHGLVFRWIGARRVGYGYSRKGLMIYAYAQQFPVSLRELALIAIMPFTVITATLITLWMLLPGYSGVWAVLLLLHTLGCLGDFALVWYWFKNRHRRMYTYDDVEGEHKTYYFEAY